MILHRNNVDFDIDVDIDDHVDDDLDDDLDDNVDDFVDAPPDLSEDGEGEVPIVTTDDLPYDDPRLLLPLPLLLLLLPLHPRPAAWSQNKANFLGGQGEMVMEKLGQFGLTSVGTHCPTPWKFIIAILQTSPVHQ